MLVTMLLLTTTIRLAILTTFPPILVQTTTIPVSIGHCPSTRTTYNLDTLRDLLSFSNHVISVHTVAISDTTRAQVWTLHTIFRPSIIQVIGHCPTLCKTNNFGSLRGLLSFSNYYTKADMVATSDTTTVSMDHLTIIGGARNTHRVQINTSDQQPTVNPMLIEETAPLYTTQALVGQKVGRESIMESLNSPYLTR